jgi:large subunit ribosomal protein L9
MIKVSAKAGGNGRLFGTVTNAQVADAMHEQLGVTIDRHKIEMKDGIKALGHVPGRDSSGQQHHRQIAVQVVALK